MAVKSLSVVLVTATALSLSTLASAPAQANGWGHGGGAAAIFGLAAGAMIGAAAAQQPTYYQPVPGYVGYYGPRVHRVCEMRTRVNRWGEVIGERRVCWREEY